MLDKRKHMLLLPKQLQVNQLRMQIPNASTKYKQLKKLLVFCFQTKFTNTFKQLPKLSPLLLPARLSCRNLMATLIKKTMTGSILIL